MAAIAITIIISIKVKPVTQWLGRRCRWALRCEREIEVLDMDTGLQVPGWNSTAFGRLAAAEVLVGVCLATRLVDDAQIT
jgi:hypothetical protein